MVKKKKNHLHKLVIKERNSDAVCVKAKQKPNKADQEKENEFVRFHDPLTNGVGDTFWTCLYGLAKCGVLYCNQCKTA